MRRQSDEGVPIVVAAPESPSAAAYAAIAARVWDKLRAGGGGGGGEAGGGGPKITVAA